MTQSLLHYFETMPEHCRYNMQITPRHSPVARKSEGFTRIKIRPVSHLALSQKTFKRQATFNGALECRPLLHTSLALC